MLQTITIPDFKTWRGEHLTDFSLTYEVAGAALHTAPIVLVCHALTGNSNVVAPHGWWASLIGDGLAIDTLRYTIVAFNIPGNAFDGTELADPETFSLRDVASLFILGLRKIGIKSLDAIIGASMGGALVWQIASLEPSLSRVIIPVAADYKASDWLLAQTEVQKLILSSSDRPLHDARIHAMLCYRTPESINDRFRSECLTDDSNLPKVVDWLHYHGRTLQSRFSLSAYKTMTFLTGDIRVAAQPSELIHIRSEIHIISIDTDLLFPHQRAVETVEQLKAHGKNVSLHTIHSQHGHDAFLMEYRQLSEIVAPLFSN